MVALDDGALNDWVIDLAKGFNASQKEFKVVPTYKGTYDESMTAAIAAFRAGNAPHILQVYEVGTATMMAAKGAIVPVGKVMADNGYKFDPKAYISAVVGYYTAPNGQMLSFPLNSSTTVLNFNKDAVPQGRRPRPGQAAANLAGGRARRGQAQGLAATCPFTTSWSAGRSSRAFPPGTTRCSRRRTTASAALSARLVFNSPLHVRHMENLANMSKQGLFIYKGRDNTADATFHVGRVRDDDRLVAACRQHQEATRSSPSASSTLPYYPDVPGTPQNTVIGGASLWVMSGKKPAEYKGVAAVLQLPDRPKCRPRATSGPATCR